MLEFIFQTLMLLKSMHVGRLIVLTVAPVEPFTFLTVPL